MIRKKLLSEHGIDSPFETQVKFEKILKPLLFNCIYDYNNNNYEAFQQLKNALNFRPCTHNTNNIWKRGPLRYFKSVTDTKVANDMFYHAERKFRPKEYNPIKQNIFETIHTKMRRQLL